MIARRPDRDVAVPDVVAALAGRRPAHAVWENELGGLTFSVDDRFVKWAPHSSGIDLGAEAARLRWAISYTPVPEVVDVGSDGDGSWLVTRAIVGENAVSERWRADPMRAVAAIGEGLRALHDRLPVAGCPFSWSAVDRVEDARRRAADGALDRSRWFPEHGSIGSVERALELVADAPPVDRLVVCHGDACAPNTLLDARGASCAHVDLGTLGVADRWADLAVATWSTTWPLNYGPGWEQTLLDAYGIEADPERTAYYRLLWDLGP